MAHLSIIGNGNMGRAISGVPRPGATASRCSARPTPQYLSWPTLFYAVPAAVADRGRAASTLARGDRRSKHLRGHPAASGWGRTDDGPHRRRRPGRQGIAGRRVTAGGPRAVARRRAPPPEALGFLQLTLAASDKVPWSGGFGVVA